MKFGSLPRVSACLAIALDFDEIKLTGSYSSEHVRNKGWGFHPYPKRTFLIEAGWKL